MLQSFQLENFRCFEHVEMSGLRPINVIVGRNASGKTALLEGLRLALSGTPQIVPWLNQFRGIGFVMPQAWSRETFEALWETIFFQGNTEKTIRLAFASPEHTWRLRIFFNRQAQGASPGTAATTPPAVSPVPSQVPPSAVFPLVFERQVDDGERSILLATVVAPGVPFNQPGPDLGPRTAFFSSTIAYAPQDAAIWLTQLNVENRDAVVKASLRKEFPYIEDLAVGTTAYAPTGTVFLSVAGVEKKLPGPLVSAGIWKILTLACATAMHRDGILLVDEIDNGIYWDKLPAVWSMLHQLARESRCQIFASTHSYECLKALLPAMKEDEDSFSLMRTERTEGLCSVRMIVGRDARVAIEQGIDPR